MQVKLSTKKQIDKHLPSNFLGLKESESQFIINMLVGLEMWSDYPEKISADTNLNDAHPEIFASVSEISSNI